MTPTELELYQYIEENRPEMLPDRSELQSFITGRAEDSCREYESQVQGGVDPLEAQEMAQQILYENLSFSPCQIIDGIIERNCGVTAHPTVLVSCYRAVKNIFDQYPSTDDFMFTPEFDTLSELIEMPVLQYLRRHEMEARLETAVQH
jgi:hypothetical protein